MMLFIARLYFVQLSKKIGYPPLVFIGSDYNRRSTVLDLCKFKIFQ